MTMLPPFSIVIPAFNEAGRIGGTLRATLEYLERDCPESELIVVNDGSTDATSEIVREVFAAAGSITTRLIENSPNRGKGAAVRLACWPRRNPSDCFRMRICRRPSTKRQD